jgi:hypothetical protein
MDEETNDMKSPGKGLPASLEEHLRAFLPDEDLNHFREQLPSEFLADATEGLNQVLDSKNLESVVKKLNHDLHQHLAHKKTSKRRREIGDLSWTYWAIAIILLLTITGFFIIRMFLRH